MNPRNYGPHARRSPLTDPWEPLLAHETAGAVYLAIEVREAHCNGRGFVHGGLIASLADNAMGLSAVRVGRSRVDGATGALTVTLAVDFVATARVGEFLEFMPTVTKVGGTLAFVTCRVVSGERLVASAHATFRMR